LAIYWLSGKNSVQLKFVIASYIMALISGGLCLLLNLKKLTECQL
jgi:high-affinity Fe2+/Pb2+ permease